MQIGEDTDLAALDYVFAESGKVARARASGIDSSCDT
jgi:hypothetical protein